MKKVTFEFKNNKTHYIEKECECRNGKIWILMSIDRKRFQNRIERINNSIGYIFSKRHRNKFLTYFNLIKIEKNTLKTSVMKQICAVVDAQGFLFNNEFHIRECAIVCDSISLCQEFNPNIDWGVLNKEEISNIKYCMKFIHGLHLYPSDY